jgi:hypothetical protein
VRDGDLTAGVVSIDYAVDLRTGLDLVALARLEGVYDLIKPLGRQVLKGILEDHHHWRIHAGAEAFDLFPRQRAGFVRLERLGIDLLLAGLDQVARSTQHAGRGSADLDMRLRADRPKLVLGVEGRDFKHPDQRHFEHFGDMFDGGLRDPAFLLLCAHEQRDHRRLLAAPGIFPDRLLRPCRVRPVEGETGWLKRWLCEATD